jgi:uncharacterized protein (TIGR02145 family)
MKRFIVFVVFLILFCSMPVLALDAPTLTVTTSGVNVTLSWTTVPSSWTPVPSVTGYTLFYAPYPDASYIGQIDMGTQTSLFSDASGVAFYVAIQSYNASGSSGYSNIEYFDLSSSNSSNSTCGAYVAPGVWKEFDCYNLAAIGKTTKDDPFIPSWRLIGGYWQWGRKGPDSSQWYDTNTANFAHGPTGPDSGDANAGIISSWDNKFAPDDSWSDTSKTINDPCPVGYRVPTKSQWQGVLDNNTQSTVGTWNMVDTNYSGAWFFGNALLLPTTGYRNCNFDSVLLGKGNAGSLGYRGANGYYWSSTQSTTNNAGLLIFASWGAMTDDIFQRLHGMSVRCVAE